MWNRTKTSSQKLSSSFCKQCWQGRLTILRHLTELNNSPTAVTGGKTKPPKHIMLALRSSVWLGIIFIHLMRTMDWLGCGVSYTHIAEIDTARCLQKLEESHTGVALPRNIITCIHHASMGQYRPLGGDDQWRGHIAPGQLLCNPESSDQYHNVIWSEPRQTGPGCQVKNLKWLLTRMSNPKEDQAISSWTRFNTPSTVNEDPTQTLNIMETQGLKESVCVFDQVFYVKTAESLGSMINSRTLYSEW